MTVETAIALPLIEAPALEIETAVPEPRRRVHVGVMGEMLPPIERKDGETAPTVSPVCQREDCDGTLRDTGRSQTTASAGVISDLQCNLCSRHAWWRHKPAWELVTQDLVF